MTAFTIPVKPPSPPHNIAVQVVAFAVHFIPMLPGHLRAVSSVFERISPALPRTFRPPKLLIPSTGTTYDFWELRSNDTRLA